MRVAAVDIGTNTVLLLVAERDANGTLVAVDERAIITRLGQGVDRTRALLPEAVARTQAAIEEFAGIIQRLGASRIDVVGTSAMRDASGSDALRAFVEATLGVPARTISGDEESRLTFAGALSGLPGVGTEEAVRVFDIGGGSTEVVHGVAHGAIAYATSFDVGSVRLTERFVPQPADAMPRATFDAIRAYARESFATIPAFETTRPPVGIAGTMTTLAAVAQAMETYDGARVHGSVLDVRAIEELVWRLARMPLAERARMPGLEPKRADVIVAGGLIALAYLEQTKANVVMVSDRGVRWGLAERLAR